MYGLNIHLFSFKLYANNVHPNDKIRVSITSIPEESKQAFIIEAKKINDVHHFFTLNITDKTKKIIFVFRKKSIIQNDPIIASTIIHRDEFPISRSDSQNTELKQIIIYEPIGYRANNANFIENRQILGQMQIQMSLQDSFVEISPAKYNYNISKIHKGEGYSMVNGLNNNENADQDNSLFVDNFVPIN